MFTIPVQSVIILSGPSNCGKTYFCQNILIPKLSENLKNAQIQPIIHYLSSDEIRNKLLGTVDTNKHFPIMTEISGPAFQILHANLEAFLTYPSSPHFVVVDTTGLSDEFHQNIYQMCNSHNYERAIIVFNYKSRKDYHKFSKDNKLISYQVDKLKQKLLPKLSNYKFKFQICQPLVNTADFKLDISNLEYYKSCLLDSTLKYLIIGDVHACFDEFKSLLTKAGTYLDENNKIHFTDPKKLFKIILVGDYLDKGVKIKEIIELIYDNLQVITVVIGNHEKIVYRIVNEDPTIQLSEKIVSKYFNSAKVLKDDATLRGKFLTIFKKSKHLVKYTSANSISKSFIVTHSPCRHKFLDRFNEQSVKQQIQLDFEKLDKSDDKYKIINDLASTPSFNFPYHVCGHISVQREFRGFQNHNDNIMIDTGCIYGNKLTGVLLGNEVKQPMFYSIDFMHQQPFLKNNLLDISTKSLSINSQQNCFDRLHPRDQKRIMSLGKNKVNYISGTVCPANKSQTELESLNEGLKYYSDIFNKYKIVDKKIVVQIKHMGSRFQYYYFVKQPQMCYGVTRNGFVNKTLSDDIKNLIYLQVSQQLEKYAIDNHIQLMIIDGELVPWSVLGKGLIETRFVNTCKGIENEIESLKLHGFDEKLNEYKDFVSQSSIKNDMSTLSPKEMISKYGQGPYQSYKQMFHSSDILSLDVRQSYLQQFRDQIDIYGLQDQKVKFKMFNLLKIKYKCGKEIIPYADPEDFNMISISLLLCDHNQFMVLDLDHDPINNQIILEKFFRRIVDENFEGVVIKPKVFHKHVAQYMKVRNEDYLTIIYGYDFKNQSKYKNLMQKKHIDKKLKLSIEEFNLGTEMLKIKYDDISFDNSDYTKICVKMLNLEKVHKQVDPRL